MVANYLEHYDGGKKWKALHCEVLREHVMPLSKITLLLKAYTPIDWKFQDDFMWPKEHNGNYSIRYGFEALRPKGQAMEWVKRFGIKDSSPRLTCLISWLCMIKFSI